MKEVYLDNAATTQVSAPCAKAAFDAMTCVWGNPSSRHKLGCDAEDLLKNARSVIARELSADDKEIIFTSGGTEANNLAVFGAARAKRRIGNRVIISAIEHSSVLESAAQLEKEGFEIIRIPPDTEGRISLSDIEDSLNEQTVLLSFMMVNNELGTVTPVSEIARLLRRRKSKALLHCDAVQGFGKLSVKVRELGCDLLSVSGHKIHAPKGIGALYCKKGVRISPIIYGGEQQSVDAQFKPRPGTEPMPAIAAFGEAVRRLLPQENRLEKASMLNSYLRSRLADEEIRALAPVTINSPDDALPAILSIATGCIKSETLLNYLSANGVYVSSGSACSKGRASHVLTHAHLPNHIADSTIRVSFCDSNTVEDIDIFVYYLCEALRTLVRFR